MGCGNSNMSPEVEAAQHYLATTIILVIAMMFLLILTGSLMYSYGEAAGELRAYKNLLESKATSFCEEDHNETLVNH